jgi:hypothetical protein
MEGFKFEQSGTEVAIETLVEVVHDILAQDSPAAQAFKAACNAQGIPHENVSVWIEDSTKDQRAALAALFEQLSSTSKTQDLNLYEKLKPIAKEIADVLKTLE